MNTQKTYAEQFDAAIIEAIEYGKKELSQCEKIGNEVADKIYDVIELAKDAYQEGNDYYGTDYLSQNLSWDEKKLLEEIMANNLPITDMITTLRDLSKRLDGFIRDLQSEVAGSTCINTNVVCS